MEILAIVLLLLAVIGHFVEGFAVFNFIQFFRGRETPLEKMVKRNKGKRIKPLNRDEI